MIKLFTRLSYLSLMAFTSFAQQAIKPNNPQLTFKGTKYISSSDELTSFSRFSPELMKMNTMQLGFNPKKAATTSGIRLLFKSDSSKLTFHFTASTKEENRGSDFAVFANDQFLKEFIFKKMKSDKMAFSVEAPKDGFNTYEVTLPSWSNAKFQGLEIDKAAEIKLYTYDRPIYVAFGDSISHGVGQRSAKHLTWPFKLSRHLKADLSNVAVGGGKVSLPVAKQLAELDKIDFMTCLIGYNDWCGNGKTVEQYTKDYKAFLNQVRSAHPKTKIFCISMLYTRTKISKKSKLPIDGFRQAVYDIVAERQAAGDKNISLIKGESLTSEANLREDQKSDPVHLGIKGADDLANKLQKIIAPQL